MKRARSKDFPPSDAPEPPSFSLPVDPCHPAHRHDFHHLQYSSTGTNDAAIIHNIASFMTLSDAASLASGFVHEDDGAEVREQVVVTPADSWAVGVEIDSSCRSPSWSIPTPMTPALVALSPGFEVDDDDLRISHKLNSFSDPLGDDDGHMESVLSERRRRWAQEKLISAIFAHQGSLRSFCREAYAAAQRIREEQRQLFLKAADPETLIEPTVAKESRDRQRLKLIHDLIDLLFNNVPLSVLIDVVDAIGDLTFDTSMACFRLTGKTINGIVKALVNFLGSVWDTITNFNPFQLLEAIISMQFNAMGKTSEALASGIQSVATGVGSASSMALHRLSVANHAQGSSSSLAGGGGWKNKTTVNKKLLRKLSTINDAARVLAYKELDDTGGLTRHAISRTRRMMHYTVSLKPFVATVALSPSMAPNFPMSSVPTPPREGLNDTSLSFYDESESESQDASDGSPFMCTPQSFPPTPHSRHLVMLQKSRFSEDDVFAARDRLRVHGALASEDERTREMAEALKENSVLAVFDDKDIPNDIQLSCGKHIATKIGNLHYSNTRGMIPLLRNCYVYFEITVLPHMGPVPPIAMPTLSIGLSTEEMPANTLVGAWQGSVGLCTTGQILLAGQWYSPPDPSLSCYTSSATVGCLVFLGDDTAFETWDGVMITASVIFAVNGQIVHPAKAPTATMANAVGDSGKASAKPGSATFSMSPDSVNMLVPAAEDVYPTVTLQSAQTSVMCRFSSEDILASSRAMIGAPDDDSIVYAVDGSVLDF